MRRFRTPHSGRHWAPHSIAWLSLDEDDNDPTRFLTYVIAALQTCQASLGTTAGALLAAPQAPPPKAILTLLLNDLATLTAPLVLVLDDYHLMTNPAIHDALAFWVDHLPPSCHLVITTRIDPPLPLARWRVRNQLTELRADDLRFRSAEVVTFLNVMGLTLTAAEIATLETRTEGWIAGLQLAALSLQGRADLASYIQAFSGSHGYIVDYLAEEVLHRQPENVQTFLLQTSLLARLSGPLCDAITGRADSQDMLETLQQRNLFIVPLDESAAGIGIISSLPRCSVIGCNGSTQPCCQFYTIGPARGMPRPDSSRKLSDTRSRLAMSSGQPP